MSEAAAPPAHPLLTFDQGQPVWVPVVVIRASGKPCICYHPWANDEGCDCNLPTEETP